LSSFEHTFLSYPIFWPITFFLLVFWTHFTQLFSQHFYSLFHSILQFISQHFTCSYLSILSVYFASILLVYSSIFNLLNLNFFTNFLPVYFSTFHFLFPRFTCLLNLRSFVVPDEISVERYFKIPHFWFRKGQFYLPFICYLFCLIFSSYFILHFHFIF